MKKSSEVRRQSKAKGKKSYQKVKAQERKAVAEGAHSGRKWGEFVAKKNPKKTQGEARAADQEGQVYMLNHQEDD